MLLIVIICSVFSSCGSFEDVSGNPSEPITTKELDIGGFYKYYFNTLTDREKGAYNSILKELDKAYEKTCFPSEIKMQYLSQGELNNVYRAVLYDNPMIFFLDGGTVRGDSDCFFPEYSLSFSEYLTVSEKINNELSQIESELNQLDTQAEKEMYIHKYIIDNCEYKDNSQGGRENSIDSVFVDSKASCEGYAKTAKLLFDMAGTESYVITGETTDDKGNVSPHMWNIVKTDGKWYHLDVTWDDPIVQNGGSSLRYTYYNLSDEEISKTHSGYEKTDVCESVDANYFLCNGLLFSEYDEETRMKISEEISDNFNSGNTLTQFKFTDKTVFDKAVESLFDGEDIYRLLQIASLSSDGKIKTREVAYETNEPFFIVYINVAGK